MFTRFSDCVSPAVGSEVGVGGTHAATMLSDRTLTPPQPSVVAPPQVEPQRTDRRPEPDEPPLRVLTLPAVYSPSHDSRLLAEAVAREDLAGGRVLDLCTGSGFVAVTAARAGAAEVVATDVSRRAVLTARLNFWRNGERGSVFRGDLLEAASPGHYDLIVSNPPYVPAPREALPTRGRARAWDGGRDGRAIVDRICREAPARLRPGGRLLLVHSGVTDPERTIEALRSVGMQAEVSMCRHVPFGPVMTRRARLLREARLIDDGQRTEQLVVIRAVASDAPDSGPGR